MKKASLLAVCICEKGWLFGVEKNSFFLKTFL